MNSKLRILDLLLILALMLGISSAASAASPAPAQGKQPQTAQPARWQSIYPDYHKVRMASATDGWVVGTEGVIKRYFGNNIWGEFASPVTTTLTSVFPISGTAWAVGDNNVMLNFVHGDWLVVPGPAGCTNFTDVWMLSPTDGWAVGSDCSTGAGVAAHYDGLSWQLATLPANTPALYALQMISPGEGWAVGNQIILHYIGGVWETNSQPALLLISLAMLPDGSQGWAGALFSTGSPLTLHYSGGVWGNTVAKPAVKPKPEGVTSDIYLIPGIAALSATDRWLMGAYANTSQHGILAQASGANSWTIAPTSDAEMTSVYMVASNDVWAVGTSGYIKHYDGTSWTNIQGAILAVNGVDYNNNRSELYQVGYSNSGSIIGTNTNSGTITVSCSTPAVVWKSVTTLDSDSLDAWVVGYGSNGGYAAEVTSSGCNVALIAGANLNSVFLAGSTVVAVGDGGIVAVNTNNHWTLTNLGSSMLHGVTYGYGRWWAVGENSAIYTTTGDPSVAANWQAITSPNSNDRLYSVSADSSTTAWAVGYHVRYHISTTPSVARSVSDNDLRAVYVTGPSSAWAVGYSAPGLIGPNEGAIEQFDGNSWNTVDTGGSPANSLTFTASGEGWAGGNGIDTNLGSSSYQFIPGYLLHFYAACYDYYYDVPANYFAGGYIFDLSCKGIVSGIAPHIFSPNANATRIQFAKIITLARGWTFYNPQTPDFSDVATTNPLYVFVETAYHNGAISGATQATCTARGLVSPCFLPNDPITRAQTVIITVRAYNWPINTTGGPHFTDVPTTNYAYNAVETAYNKGVVSGTGGGLFSPNANVTRGQIAKIVDLALHAP